jgi:iron complex transport system permease protein
MRRFSVGQLLATNGISLAVWGAVAGMCLFVGSTGLGRPTNDFELSIRAQSVMLASLVGAALAAAGVTYQAILRNPLAEPYLLGVSSGASLAAYVWRFPAFSGVAVLASGATQQAFAFAGALATVAVVFTLASRRGRLEPVTLLLVGVIVNAVNGSVFLLLNALKPELTAQGGGMMAFLVGAIQTNLRQEQKYVAAAICGAMFLALMYVSGALNVAALSDAEAQSLGVRVHRLRWVGLVAASLMTASAVAVSGPIGFVGLVCPHLARSIVGHDVRRLMPLSAALGAALLASADALSRGLIMTFKTWPPVGVLTGLIGGPFFLYLLYRERNRASAEGLA